MKIMISQPMNGWENARGCKIEHEIALKYKLFIKEL